MKEVRDVIIETKSYPTRYVAFDNPRKFVIQKNIQHRGGYELAYFSFPIKNYAFPHLTDGIWLEVYSYQGKKIVVDYTCISPDTRRQQSGVRKEFPNADYLEAINYALSLAFPNKGFKYDPRRG